MDQGPGDEPFEDAVGPVAPVRTVTRRYLPTRRDWSPDEWVVERNQLPLWKTQV